MAIVRKANPEDLPRILEMRERSYDVGRLEEIVGPYDASHFADIFVHALVEEKCWLLVAETEDGIVGCSFGVLAPVWLVPNTMAATEAFIWVEPEHRGAGIGRAIFDAVENWARSAGADFVCMSSYPHLSPKRMRAVCSARGYIEIETNHIRRIN